MPQNELDLFEGKKVETGSELDLFERKQATVNPEMPTYISNLNRYLETQTTRQAPDFGGEQVTGPITRVPLQPREEPLKQTPREVPQLSTAPKGMPLFTPSGEMHKYTGNAAEEYIAQFMGKVAEGITLGMSETPARQGLPGESAVRVAGEVTGSIPGLGVAGAVIGNVIKSAATKMPQHTKKIITLTRAFFTEEAVRGAINNSKEFYLAFKSGNVDAMENAAAGALVDVAFAGLMARGWVQDAVKLKALHQKWVNDRFAAARNVTPPEPNPPTTIAEATAKAQEVAAAPSAPETQPSPELKSTVEAKDITAEVSSKIKRTKVKKVAETEEQLKARMEKVRAARKPKTVVEAKEQLKTAVEESKTEVGKKVEEAKARVAEAELKTISVKEIQDKVNKSFGGPEGVRGFYSSEQIEKLTGHTSAELSKHGLIKQNKVGNWEFTGAVTGDVPPLPPEERAVPEKVPVEKDINKLTSQITAQPLIEAARADRLAELTEEPVRSKIETTPPKTTRAEIDQLFETIYNNWPEKLAEIKRAKKFRVDEIDVPTGTEFKVPPTWHDGVFRYSVLRTPDGKLTMGSSGSYDTIMGMPDIDTGKVIEPGAAGAHRGTMPPGYTLYVVDLGPASNARHIRVYRSVGNAEAERVRPAALPPAEPPTIDIRPEKSELDYFGEGTGKQPEIVTADLEKFFGKDILDITEQEVADYLAGKAKPGVPKVEEPKPFETDLENYYNKSADEITDAEVDAFLNRQRQTEPLTEVDTQTGSPEPAELVGDNSIFAADKAATDARTKQYAKNGAIATDMNDALAGSVASRKDIAATGWKLANDVNRWIHGENVDITSTRNFLSEIAARAEEFIGQFESTAGFADWKETISEMANWARKTDRSGTKLMSGIDPFEAAIKLRDALIKIRSLVRGFKKSDPTPGESIPLFYYKNRIGQKFEDHLAYYEPGKLTDEYVRSNADALVFIGKKRIDEIKGVLESQDKWPDSKEVQQLKNDLLKQVENEEDRSKIKPTGGMSLYSGIDPFEVAKGVKKWYSALRKVAEEKLPNVAPAEQIANTLRKQVTQDEWKASKLDELLKPGTRVRKDEVLAQIDRNVPEFKDVVLEDKKESWTPTLYSGIPVEEGTKIIASLGRKFKDAMNRDRGTKQKRAREVHKETREELVRALVERSGNIAKILTDPKFYDEYGDIGFRTLRNMYLSRGGTPRATNMYRQFAKEVYGGLSRKESEIVDNLAMAIRMVDIGKYKTEKEFNFPEGKDPVASAQYLDNFAAIEELTPEQARKLYYVNPDGTIGGRVGIGFEHIKVPIDHLRDEAGGLIGVREHDDLVSHKYRRLGTVDKPATLAEVLDKKYEQKIGDIPRSVYDSGIDVLAKGKETDILEPSWKLMAFETFARAYGRIANNEANHTLLELATKFPNNPFVRTKIRPITELESQPTKRNELINSIEIKRLERGVSDYELRGMVRIATSRTEGAKTTGNIKKATVDSLKALDLALGEKSKSYTSKGDKLPKGWVPTYVYDKGHRTTVWLEPNFAKEWIINARDITPRAARLLKWATMAPVTRLFATGIEPGFALANLPRDMMHLWFAAREFKDGKWVPVYSSIAPAFSAQLSADLKDVGTDAFLRTGWYNDYIAYGGGMDFLTMQGRPFSKGLHIDSNLEKVLSAVGHLNSTSEIATRLAIMVRSVKNQAAEKNIAVEEARKDPEIMRNATFAARDYMDFAQGGWAVKLLDQGIPYFNASLVGMRTFARSFKKDGKIGADGWYKLGQFALLTAGIYIASRETAPETMKALEGDYRTQNNFIIPLGDEFSFEDEQGQVRYPFLMIPLDPSLRFPKKLFEFSAAEMRDENPDPKGTLAALRQMSPADISTMPPLEAAILEYFINYDLYRQRAIRKEGEVFDWPKSRSEITTETPDALKQLGEITGASPERLKVAIGELVSANSTWAQIIGKTYKEVFGQMPKEDRDMNLTETLSRTPIVKRFIGITSPYARFSETVNEANQNVAWERFNQRNGLDILINGSMYKKAKGEVRLETGKFPYSREGIESYMRSFNDKQVYDRLNDRLKFAERTQDLPHRSLWMRMQAQANEARAATYVKEVMTDPKLLQEFMEADNRMGKTSQGRLATENFRREVMKLQAR